MHPHAPPFRSLLALSLVLLVAACSAPDTNVESETSALGRVVVYRNGIAYYERSARVEDGHLVLRVPNDKVDDFLKSLTVINAKTGKAMPLSFPTKRGGSGGKVIMTIQLPPPGPHDLRLSYITEAPAWKSSYRVMVDKEGKVRLEGWAIVDNTSGEDWKAVRVGVGSSSALSFRFDLRSVRRVHRQQLHSGQSFVQAPPRGGSVHQQVKAEDQTLMELGDKDIPRMEGHPDRAGGGPSLDMEALQAAPGRPGGLAGLGGKGKRRKDSVTRSKRARGAEDDQEAQLRYRVQQDKRRRQQQLARQKQAEVRVNNLARKLGKDQAQYVIEGYANPGAADGREEAMERAHALRNQLIKQGVEPGRLVVAARGVVKGRRAGVRLVKARGGKRHGAAGQDDGQPVGESHFESPTPMTVARGTSAMVPVLQQGATGEVVYLYDAEAARGDDRYAFKSVRFRNPTQSTLETGPMTVYGNGRFIGEGLAAAIQPKAIAVVPFALDRQVVIEKAAGTADHIHRLLKVNRGVVTAEVQHLRTTKLKITSRLHKSTRVFIRHTLRRGWKLVEHPKQKERLGQSWLFEIALPAGKTVDVKIAEATPLRRTVDLRSDVGVSLVRVWLKAPGHQGKVAKHIGEVLAMRGAIDRQRETISSLRQRAREYRERMDELHMQIVSLQEVKAGGSLLGHLKSKMKQISERVQKNTIATVNAQEQLMLARVRFQDAVSELTLKDATKK